MPTGGRLGLVSTQHPGMVPRGPGRLSHVVVEIVASMTGTQASSRALRQTPAHLAPGKCLVTHQSHLVCPLAHLSATRPHRGHIADRGCTSTLALVTIHPDLSNAGIGFSQESVDHT